MQAEYLKRRFEIKDDLHRLISGIELSRSLKTEEKEVKDGVNQLEVKGYEKQTVNIEYNVSGQWGTAPYIEYMEMASLFAGHSSCVKRKVGAVLVKDLRILSTGYI